MLVVPEEKTTLTVSSVLACQNRNSSSSPETLNSNSYAFDNEGKLVAFCKAKMPLARQDCRMLQIQNTKKFSVLLSLWCTTLWWPELWYAFPPGPKGRQTDREGYMCVLVRGRRGGGGLCWVRTMTFPIPLHKWVWENNLRQSVCLLNLSQIWCT